MVPHPITGLKYALATSSSIVDAQLETRKQMSEDVRKGTDEVLLS